MIKHLFSKISWKEDRCLFDHWLEHYRRLSVKHFHIIVHTYRCDNWAFVRHIESQPDVVIVDQIDKPFNDGAIIRQLVRL